VCTTSSQPLSSGRKGVRAPGEAISDGTRRKYPYAVGRLVLPLSIPYHRLSFPAWTRYIVAAQISSAVQWFAGLLVALRRGHTKKRGGAPGLKKTRILYVAHGHADFHPGGGELAAFFNYRAFRESDGYESFLVARAHQNAGPHPGTLLACDEGDRHTYFFCTDESQYDFFYESFLPKSPEASGSVLNTFRDLLLATQPDIVHFHHYQKLGVDLIGYVHQVLPHARIVVTLHEFAAICAHFGSMITRGTHHRLCDGARMHRCTQCFPERSAEEFFLRKRLILRNFEHVDLFLSPSRFLKQRYEDWGIAPERIVHCENGRPVWTLDEIPERPRNNRFVISFFGQIVFHKGVDVFLKAALEYALMRDRALAREDAGFPEIRFAIHGKMGNLPEKLRDTLDALLETANEVVDDHGPYQPSQMKDLVQSTDAVVVPSIWWENSPMVIQEAFMAKKPVICSNIGGCAEHVEDRISGLHFPVGNHFALLNRILELAGNHELYSRLVAGIPPVMTTRAMFELLDGEYQRIMHQPSRARHGSSGGG
jgi:glycosyltransferase involved in cell wall biosynthesis